MSGSKRKGSRTAIGTTSDGSTTTAEAQALGPTLEPTSTPQSEPVSPVPVQSASAHEATAGERRRKPQAVMDETVRRVVAGESIEALALEIDVAPKAIRAWVRKAGKSTRPAVSMDVPPVENAQLHKALAGAGITPETIPPLEPAQTAQRVEATGVLPPPSPEQLMLIIEGIDRVTISAIVGVKGKRIPTAKLEQLTKLPKADRDMMEALAPYAADYLPTAMAYAKPAMAILFVATWGLSVTMRLKAVSAMAQEYAPSPRVVPTPTPSEPTQ